MERGAEEEGRRADKEKIRCNAGNWVPRDESLGRGKEGLGTMGRAAPRFPGCARGRAALRRPTGHLQCAMVQGTPSAVTRRGLAG